jgi:hypothetical protein
MLTLLCFAMSAFHLLAILSLAFRDWILARSDS